jgi:hypothetical protein
MGALGDQMRFRPMRPAQHGKAGESRGTSQQASLFIRKTSSLEALRRQQTQRCNFVPIENLLNCSDSWRVKGRRSYRNPLALERTLAAVFATAIRANHLYSDGTTAGTACPSLLGYALHQHKLHLSQMYGLLRDQAHRIFFKNDGLVFCKPE